MSAHLSVSRVSSRVSFRSIRAPFLGRRENETRLDVPPCVESRAVGGEVG